MHFCEGKAELFPLGENVSLKLKLKLIYDRHSVGQSVLVSGAHLGPLTNFSFAMKFSVDSCGFAVLWRPLWREDGSVIYCLIASGPCQSSHSWAEVSSETPPTWRARFLYLYPPGTGWPSYTPGRWVNFLSPLTTLKDYGGVILTRLHTENSPIVSTSSLLLI
jgi:hypothetical protein